jgi:outer membrane immunogenic protein
MRHWLLAAIAFTVSLSQSALAADMPAKAPRAAPLQAIYNWSGFYAGANIGYGWGHADADATATITAIGLGLNTGNNFITPGSGDASASSNGLLGGLQAGYNWQGGSWVYGLEGDFQATGQRDDGVFASTALLGATINGVVATSTVTNRTTYKLPWFGTARGRIGYAVDRWLLYATGGLAFGEIRADSTITTAFSAGVGTPPPAQLVSTRDVRAGWVVGAGVETAFATNWSVKAEYLHMDFGSIDQSFTTPAVASAFATISASGNLHARLTDDIGRIGINYKFQ